MHFILINKRFRLDLRIGTRFLVKKVHFLLTNEGSGWIHEDETMFVIKEVHFLLTNEGRFKLDSRDWNEVFGY